jgi:hypothetical protein
VSSISAPKSLKVVLNTRKNYFIIKRNIFLELRHEIYPAFKICVIIMQMGRGREKLDNRTLNFFKYLPKDGN